MSQERKRKSSIRPNLRPANVFLALLMLLTFMTSLLLYFGLVSTRKSLDTLSHSREVPQDMVMDLARHYRWERTLELGLIAMSASMGITLFVIYRYLVRVSRTLGEVRTIDRHILNSITRGIVTVDLEGKITSCNHAVEQMLGVRATELVGRPLEALFSLEDPLHRLLKESLREHVEHWDTDLEYPVSPDKVLRLRLTTFALRNEAGKRVGGILLLKDMTEIRKMEQRIQRASRLAALGELTQRLVHEIRNPLSAMDINLQLLQEKLDLTGKDREIGRYLAIISSETRRLDEVLRNAQLFAHPRPPDMKAVDLHQIIRRVIFLLRQEATQKGVEITENLQASESQIHADMDQMEQVFINLFKNSLEAMDRGGKLEVISRNTWEDKKITVEILDTGPGIPMANVQRIFDPYYTTKKKGTGLGLSIVHAIVGQHSGTIDVGSWLGEGTLFSIALPVIPDTETNNGDGKTEDSHRR